MISTVGIALSPDFLYLLTNTYDADKTLDPQASSNTELFHLDTLRTQAQTPTNVSPNAGQGFFSTKFLVNNTTGEAYIAGVAYSFKEEKCMNHVLKYGLQADSPTGPMHLAWSRGLGMARACLLSVLGLRVLAMARDMSKDVVYVTGMVTGFFENLLDPTKGLLMVPLLSISANGTLVQMVRRSTPYPLNPEEITDIAVDPWGAVLYVGKTTFHQCASSECSGNETIREAAELVIFGSHGRRDSTPTLLWLGWARSRRLPLPPGTLQNWTM
jgi:hypothetical protein